MDLKANILGCWILLYVSLDFEKSSSSCLRLDSLSSNKPSHSTSLGSRFYLGKHLSVENYVNCKIFYSLRRQNLWVLMPISQQAYIRKKRCYGNLGQESKDMYYIRAINTYKHLASSYYHHTEFNSSETTRKRNLNRYSITAPSLSVENLFHSSKKIPKQMKT